MIHQDLMFIMRVIEQTITAITTTEDIDTNTKWNVIIEIISVLKMVNITMMTPEVTIIGIETQEKEIEGEIKLLKSIN